MANASSLIDITGLRYYHGKAEGIFAAGIEIAGTTVTLKSKSGASLGTITIPQKEYALASATLDGLMSKAHFSKLEAISAGATAVANSTTNGYILIDGAETPVYSHPTSAAGALAAGLYKVTTDATGHVIAGVKVAKGDITALGIPGQDTTYVKATASADGLMSKEQFAKVNGIATGAQVNVIEKITVNGKAVAITSKSVNIDLSGYATKDQIASAVHYKGAVENYAALPTAPATGDMYNVETADATHGIDAGVNVVWNGTSWDPMAPMITIEAATTTEIDALFK